MNIKTQIKHKTVKPHDCEVSWFAGGALIKNSKKYELSSRGHQRFLTINDVHETDQGQYMVQVQDYEGKRADDRLRIGHLRVGTASPSVSNPKNVDTK